MLAVLDLHCFVILIYKLHWFDHHLDCNSINSCYHFQRKTFFKCIMLLCVEGMVRSLCLLAGQMMMIMWNHHLKIMPGRHWFLHIFCAHVDFFFVKSLRVIQWWIQWLQSAPLICTSVISTLRLFAQRASSPVWVYAMWMAVNFAYKHQPYMCMHNSAISTDSFGPSAMTYFSYKQLGWHSACKTTCSQPLNTHWDAGDEV